MSTTLLYVRNPNDPTLVRELTAQQAARCTESPVGSNNYTDSANAITGTIFGGVSSQGTYCRDYDRWYDPTIIPAGMTCEAFFATQPEAGAAVGEAEQWWPDPTPASTTATTTATDAANSVTDAAGATSTVSDASATHDAPADGKELTIPDSLTSKFPSGSTVTMQPGTGALVASVPAPHEDGFHHIVAEIGEGIDHLAARVEAFVKRVL
jgi:hypothetical protein